MSIKSINEALAGYAGIKNLESGVAVYGEASAYALVWELGSRRLKSPGPKTMWSTNRFGDRAILTRQAPYGYVGTQENVSQFWPIIIEELDKVNFSSNDPNRTALEIEVAMDNAAHRIARIISDSAPVDSGTLRAGIQGVDVDEVDVLSMDADADAGASSILIL